MTANGWFGYWILVMILLAVSGVAGMDFVWASLSRFGRAAAWTFGTLAVTLLVVGALVALGVAR